MNAQVYAKEFMKGFNSRHAGYLEHKCDTIPALDVPETWDCWGFMKNPAVVVPIEELRVAVMHALDFVSPTPFINYQTND